MPVCTTCGTSYGSSVRICVRDGTPLVTGPANNQYLGTLLDGKYRIDASISAGGMGSVFRAQHVMLDKTVAVKVIKNELVTSDEIVARFQREARAASNLDHPNIVSVYDLGQTADGTLYIAMEFIDGPSLRQVIREKGALTPQECLEILRQVASALAAAHRKQIVHRDLKSDNLMLESEDGRRVVKLVDFGIAKTFDDSTQLTAAGFMLGTPRYMSPEQAAGKPVDHRADLYSLGVILYEMLTGDVPFGDAVLTSMLVKLATEVPAPPSARRPEGHVPPALDAVAMRCLEKDPERRFQSADEFADALERAVVDTDSQPTMPPASIAAVEPTLVRPTNARKVATHVAETSHVVPPPTVIAQPSPDVQLRAGLSVGALIGRVAVGLLVLVVVAAGVLVGLRLTNKADVASGFSRTSEAPVKVVSGSPGPSAVEGSRTAQAPADIGSGVSRTSQPPSPSPTNVPSSAAPSAPPLSTDSGRGVVSQRTEITAKTPAPPVAVARPPVRAPTPTPAQTVVDPAPPAPVPVAAPAPAPVPTPPAQPARSASVSFTCQGAPDVCNAIRSEIVRALQADVVGNTASADVAVTAIVAVVSETPSNQFGTPSIVRTYSVELTGNARGTSLVMPAKRVFGFDALFGRNTLQDNARQLASGVVEAVRTFTAAGK